MSRTQCKVRSLVTSDHSQRTTHYVTGTVTVICGCMFSGKTTELLRRLVEYPRGKALAFKHAIDTRYSASAIVSHCGRTSPAIVVKNADEIEQHITKNIELVAIDEAHFFDEGLADVATRLARTPSLGHGDGRGVGVLPPLPTGEGRGEGYRDRLLANRHINIVLTSLQPDSWGRPFPVAQRLLAIADECIMTTAICARCGAVADRTQRLSPIIDGRMVVEPSNYEPRCRKCWRSPHESPM